MQRVTKPTSYLFQAAGLLLIPCITTAQILTFGPNALPTCAYGCTPLYSAQYDCPSEAVAGDCFCQTAYIEPSIKGGLICPDVCPPGAGGEEVNTWIRTVCEKFVKTPEDPKDEKEDPTETEEGEADQDEDKEDEKDTPNKSASVKTARAIAW